MLKRTMLFSSIALAAIALTAPAAAQADWTHEGVPITGHHTIELTGEFGFNITPFGSGFGCTAVHINLTIGPGTSEVTSFNQTTGSCSGTGPVFSNCILVKDNATGLPWPAHTSASAITLTPKKIDNHYSNCSSGITETEIQFSQLVLTPDDPSSISTLSVSGTTASTHSLGSFAVTNAPGTYGIQ